jgi:2,3,4,5-tetrahydropyridine-2-carboxylate N-succinyltransferase
MEGGDTRYYDKVPTKFDNYDAQRFRRRRLPCGAANAVARTGSFIGKGVVLMPSYVNIGAYVG